MCNLLQNEKISNLSKLRALVDGELHGENVVSGIFPFFQNFFLKPAFWDH